MARVFTTEFEFNYQNYKAIVALKNDHEKMNIHIRVFDQELIDILGHHIVEFTGPEGYKQMSQLDHPLSLALLDTINKAILSHLRK